MSLKLTQIKKSLLKAGMSIGTGPCYHTLESVGFYMASLNGEIVVLSGNDKRGAVSW